MTSEERDWQRLDAALLQSLALPEPEREAALRAALSDRPDLLGAALSALRSDTREPSMKDFAPGLLDAISSDLDRREDGHWQDRSVGPWRILERIGQGGMGAVYRGERADGAFKREVAIKLLPLSLQDPDMIRRFEQERRIAARLDHPNIARLLDGGSAEDGSPWLVMEYVDGLPIDRYADQKRLSLRERVELLGQVCDAVQFAHRNLVVHRDLKPANILVDGEGRVRLLDFGIARLLEDIDPEGDTVALGARLTPNYAAPEQLAGGSITVATDVYALGCLAYRLLAGRVPLALAGRPLAQMLNEMTEAERPALSVVARDTAPPGLRCSEVDADLDAIAGKAVQADPGSRYGSAHALCADLQHWLDGLPIDARPIGQGQRAAKFIRRHRSGVALAAVVFTTLALIAGVALHQAGLAREQRDEARAVAGMLKDLMQLASPDVGMGHEVDAPSLLKTALDTTIGTLDAGPETRIELLETLAEALLAFELADDALRARQEIHAIEVQRFGPEHPRTLSALRQYAVALREQRGDFDECERLFQWLLDKRRTVLGPEHPDTAESYHDLGFLYLRYADRAHPGREHSIDLIETAHRIYVQQLGAEHPLSGQALFDLGLATVDRDLRIDRMRRGIAIRQRHAQPDDLQLLQHEGDLALVLSESGYAEEGLELGRLALEAFQAARGELHPVSLMLQNNLAGMYRDHGRYEDALTLYRRVDELVRATVPENHLRRAFPQFGVGKSLNALGRPAEALPWLLGAVEILEHNQSHNLVAITRVELGDSLRAQGREGEARAEYRTALGLWTEQLGRPADDPQLTRVQDRLAVVGSAGAVR